MEDNVRVLEVVHKELPPVPEVIETLKWLTEEANKGNIRELICIASDTGIDPIYKIVGECVNFPMVNSVIDVVKSIYMKKYVIHSIIREEDEDYE